MRFILTLYIAKIVKLISKYLHIGTGYTWAGNIALKIYPNLLKDSHFSFTQPSIFITGTNGKTTTSKLITHLLSAKGYKVLTNATGANILNGVVSSLLLNFDLMGRFKFDYIVLEVDEFSLPKALDFLTPDVLVLLNLSRDQLDRYGETDLIMQRWEAALELLPPSTSLVLPKNKSQFSTLDASFKGSISYFDDSLDYLTYTQLKGSFNAQNINAAFVALSSFAFSPTTLIPDLSTFTSAYGRGEVLGKFHIYLAKNPASFNNNLTLLKDFSPEDTVLLFVLNDNIPDGRDVSWIYDIDTASLYSSVSPYKHIYISGTRCLDMGVRMHYAGVLVPEENIVEDLQTVLRLIEKMTPDADVLALPNYSSMLELRKILTGRAIL